MRGTAEGERKGGVMTKRKEVREGEQQGTRGEDLQPADLAKRTHKVPEGTHRRTPPHGPGDSLHLCLIIKMPFINTQALGPRSPRMDGWAEEN